MSEQILLNQIQSNYLLICEARKEIADLTKQKAIKRAESWAKAEGTAKEKEDFVKAQVADIQQQIDHKEANIKYMEDMVEIWYTEMVYTEDE